VLIVCLARPALYERRVQWGDGQSCHRQIRLKPLSQAESGELADELLQRLAHSESAVRELLIGQAEGNPLYMEELLKMLIDEGVIVKGEEVWRTEISRLERARVPPTLIGVLQARLDSLSPMERAVLRWASVVGHVFWDSAAVEVGREEAAAEVILEALAGLARRELILAREHSVFAGTKEYAFRHAMLQETAYESVLRRLRRQYHRRAAAWLVASSVDRAGEYAGLIAKHFELAGDVERAVAYLRRAGEQAMRTSSHREELRFYERALALLPSNGAQPQRAALVCAIGWSWSRLGDFMQARENLASALALAREAGEGGTQTAALIGLGEVTKHQGDHLQAQGYLEEALSLARASDDERATAAALRGLGGLAWTQGRYLEATQYAEESLLRYSELSDRVGMSRCHNLMGVILNAEGKSGEAEQRYQESLQLAREAGDRIGQGMALLNLGELARLKGDLVTARERYEESLAINDEIGGHQDGAAVNIINLGLVSLAEGDHVRAMQRFREAIDLFTAIEARAGIIIALVCIAELRAKTGDPRGALELISLAMAQPAAPQQARDDAAPILAELEEKLGPEAVAAGLERGPELDLEARVRELMA
jgi:predicted ATPase